VPGADGKAAIVGALDVAVHALCDPG
jgi:hypothetical protein